MKKIVLFLSVLLIAITAKSQEIEITSNCPSLTLDRRGKCQFPKNTFKDGTIEFEESYCSGDFPYCNDFDGSCCSDPMIDGSWSCCDLSTQVSHNVARISLSGTLFDAAAYKCCDRETYGNDSIYYFDKNKHVYCCGGELFKSKSTDENKTCCNQEFYTNGDIKHYYTVANVDGAPIGATEKICCKAIGDDPGVYRSTAYWDGRSAQCCEGSTYKTGIDDSGKDTYGCCTGTRGLKAEKINGVVSLLGSPNGEQACCRYYEDENGKKHLHTAYWNGSSAQCCKGIAYQPKGKEVKEYDCCTDGKIPSEI